MSTSVADALKAFAQPGRNAPCKTIDTPNRSCRISPALQADARTSRLQLAALNASLRIQTEEANAIL